MATALRTKRYSPEELDRTRDGILYEINDAGELLRRAMGAKSSNVGATILHLLTPAAASRGKMLGADSGLRLWPDRPLRYRRPDVAFLSFERWPGELPEGHLEVAPELIVEVVSRRDEAEDLAEKVTEYFSAGVRLVWVVYPRTRLY